MIAALIGDDPASFCGLCSTRLLDDGQREFVINLERVPYIDSEALGSIVLACTDVSRRGGRLKLEALTQRVLEILRLADLTRLFEAGGCPFIDPLNPRLQNNYPRAAIATASLILILVAVSMIIWATP